VPSSGPTAVEGRGSQQPADPRLARSRKVRFGSIIRKYANLVACRHWIEVKTPQYRNDIGGMSAQIFPLPQSQD
jgi:hypothetical protein